MVISGIFYTDQLAGKLILKILPESGRIFFRYNSRHVAKKHVDIEALDAHTIRALVQAIYVKAPDKSDGKRRQKIHIEYDGIGFIPLEELAKNETA